MSLFDPIPRGLLQADQADTATGGLPWNERERGALAGLDGLVGVPATLVPRFRVEVESQLPSTLCRDTSGAVAQVGRDEFVRALWDSQEPSPGRGSPGTGVLPGFLMRSVGQPTALD